MSWSNTMYRGAGQKCHGQRWMRVHKTNIGKGWSEWKWFRRRGGLLSCFMKRVTKELEIRGNRVKVYYMVGFSSVSLVFMSSDSWSFVYFKKSYILANLSTTEQCITDGLKWPHSQACWRNFFREATSTRQSQVTLKGFTYYTKNP